MMKMLLRRERPEAAGLDVAGVDVAGLVYKQRV